MVTMSDIAAHLGVSRLTVSAVLNGRQQQVGVGAETSRRVLEAAAELGYHRNHLAVAMKTGINPVIGCMVSTLKSEWVSRTLSGLLQRLHEGEYLVKIEEVAGPAAENSALTRLIEQRIAGIFCCNFNPGNAFARKLESTATIYGVPIVCSLSRKDIRGSLIDSDDHLGVQLAVDHLWALGHRKMAFLGGDDHEKERWTGFIKAMQRHQKTVKPDRIVFTQWDLGQAETETLRLIGRTNNRPTGIICANDSIAAVAVRVARRQGLSVPDDLSVIGFSNSTICQLMDPELTSVVQPFEEIGRRCGSVLLEQLQGGGKKARRFSENKELLPTSLEVRQSTGPTKISRRRRG